MCALSWLNNNALVGIIPSSLGNLTALQYLCVRCAKGGLCALLRLLVCAFSDVSNNQLNGIIPSSMGNLTALQELCVRHA